MPPPPSRFNFTGNAKAGKHYAKAGGTLEFTDSERHARIVIALFENDAWSRDIHFEVGCDLQSVATSGGGGQERDHGTSSMALSPFLFSISLGCAQVELYDVECSAKDRNAYLLVKESRVWIVNNRHFPVGCPQHPSAEFMLHKFFIERCVARGPKVKVTAYCYVYKSFYNCVIESICLSYVFAAATAERHDGEEPLERHVYYQSFIAVVILLAATKFLEWCDFKQLNYRGRSGTRKDFRNWLITSYLNVGIECASHENIDSGECMDVFVA